MKTLVYDEEIYYEGKSLHLTPSQTILMKCLIKADGKIVTRSQLMIELWQTDQYIGAGTLTTHISRLRRQLKKQTGRPFIYTKKAGGYFLRDE